MAHPYHHAVRSAKLFGGVAEDYLPVHNWFDESKAFLPDLRHRALRHHSEGIFLCERLLGVTLRNSTGREVPVRLVGEQHVKDDLGWIPTVKDWLVNLKVEPWMTRTPFRPGRDQTPDAGGRPGAGYDAGMNKTILDVGQCGYDGPRMTKMLRAKVGVHVDAADTLAEAGEKITAKRYDLVLVNRELAFEGTEGLDLIRAMRDSGTDTPVMLVSDKPDAQAEAERLGAVHGFGKSALDDPATVDLIRHAIGVE